MGGICKSILHIGADAACAERTLGLQMKPGDASRDERARKRLEGDPAIADGIPFSSRLHMAGRAAQSQ